MAENEQQRIKRLLREKRDEIEGNRQEAKRRRLNSLEKKRQEMEEKSRNMREMIKRDMEDYQTLLKQIDAMRDTAEERTQRGRKKRRRADNSPELEGRHKNKRGEIHHTKKEKTDSSGPSDGRGGSYRLENAQAGSSSDANGVEHHCSKCGSQFETAAELKRHKTESHKDQITHIDDDRGGSESGDEDTREGGVDSDSEEEDMFKELVNKFGVIINMPHRRGKIQDEYNFSVVDYSTLTFDILEHQLMQIFKEQKAAFKMNLSLGFALVNTDGDMRYFYAHNNETVFDSPTLISDITDVKRAIEKLRSMDLLEHVFQQRPSTKWRVYRITNIRWVVTRTNYPLGSRVNLPEYIKKSKSIISLTHDQNSGRQFNDNLCLFRCLAYDRVRDVKCLERTARQLFRDYTNESAEKYTGTPLSELGNIEKHFSVNLNVFSLDEAGDVKYVWRTTGRYGHSINMNIHEGHLSFIKKMDTYSRKFKCNTCDQLYNTANILRRHEQTCEKATKLVYPGGYHTVASTVLEELEDYGYSVDVDCKFYPYFITYDFEAMLVGSERYMQEHVPVSFSVSSNVPGYEEPLCVVDAEDADALVEKFVKYIGVIQSVAREELYPRYEDIINNIELELTKADDDEERDTHRTKQLSRLKKRLETYIGQIPIIGFNSQKYDINLIKTRLVRALKLGASEDNFVVKKTNQFMCIATDEFKFIDISNYLAAGSSYDAFIKAYHPGNVRKGYFCYEFLDSPDKLNYPKLPPYESFYSSLKQQNVLEEAIIQYESLLRDGYSHREILSHMNVSEKPLSGEEKYAELERLWVNENMKTFKDYLIYYNNLDVGPFRDAVQQLFDYYIQEEKVDVFKTTISISGVARNLLFRSLKGKTHFSLFSNRDKLVHELIQRNIVGGPAIVFTRYHEKGKTRIRNGEKLCKSILGLHANSLYLGCLAEPMPTGYCSIRREETGFDLERRDKYLKAFKWLDWISKTEDIDIKHALNSDREFRIGPYRVDGFDKRSQTVFEFDGCFYHSHTCLRNPNITLQRKRMRHSEKRIRYIRSRGYRIRRIWECEFDNMVREDASLKYHCNSYRRFTENKKTMTSDEVISHVLRDELFGAVEVDISVPDYLRQKFSEMSPLFGNANVSPDDVGDYMEQVANQLGISKKPRKLLIGAMAAKKMLIATPLLKWYINHGLEVTRVYTVLEFAPDRCFKEFTEKISDVRRAGDKDPRLGVISETSKLKGNASYGSMLMRKDKHENTKYLDSECKVYNIVNSKHFRSLTELGHNHYEVVTAKNQIRMDIPIQIGYFILQYAKLRMLSFYYDCLDKYIPREDFELIEMDTDSYYMAISSENLEELVRADMKNDFDDEKTQWFPDHSSPETKAYTRRTPGLFKGEMRGDAMVALCSKTYCVVHVSESNKKNSKFSCKGINKRNLRHPIAMYKDVLFNSRLRAATNRGFRVVDNRMVTYTQDRNGFTNYYPKRKVLACGIRTQPLDITL